MQKQTLYEVWTMRTRYSKGRISIIVDYGDDTHNPDEIKNPGIYRIPYIQYEGVWYKCRDTLPVNIKNEKFFMKVVEYLMVGNYSEEIFLNKLLSVIV